MGQDEVTRVLFPMGCITASELRSLAGALDRLAAFHRDRGGPDPDAPCLLHVGFDGGRLVARVASGDRAYLLRFDHGTWKFC